MASIWQKDIMYLKRVGPLRAEALQEAANIRVYEDLITMYPRKYVDRSRISTVRSLQADQYATLVGKVLDFEVVKSKKGRGRLVASFSDGSGILELTWFQGIKWISKSLKIGETVAIFGKPTRYGGRLQLTHPEMDFIQQENGAKNTRQIVPFYASTEKLSRIGLDSRGFRSIMHHLIEEVKHQIPETLSQHIMTTCNLVSRQNALVNIHFPESYEALKAAQRRLKFEELFFFQLMLARRRSTARSMNKAVPFEEIGEHFNTFFKEHLPFELTGAQKRVIKEIRRDLAQPIQMNRLVQGDVGSGKTMVAFMCMLIAKDNGFQSALMAPTAILAEQHFKKISAHAEKLKMKVGLLVGGQKKAIRQEMLRGSREGDFDVVIGTHALIEDNVQFKRLGLVVVDEQHKFGVKQRAKLWRKANPYPHNLIMTATPIPRTLAMTLYGDVDVSIIDELPPGRKPIKTMVHGEKKRLEVLGFVRREIELGRQAYVIYPLVEESEKMDLLAATKGYELMENYFKPYRVGIVHGKMPPENKEFEMQRFVKNETQVLVSTTVIEVGVDVPNSNIIVIENAERFGLSQLHQLRGRVGRGAEQAYCILMAGHKVSQEGKTRLKAMHDTTNGFTIAEIDLKLRGPGDFLGTRQSGIPQFQLANIAEDQDILRDARQAAFDLNEKDPKLNLPENQAIRQYYRKYGQAHAGLSMVG